MNFAAHVCLSLLSSSSFFFFQRKFLPSTVFQFHQATSCRVSFFISQSTLYNLSPRKFDTTESWKVKTRKFDSALIPRVMYRVSRASRDLIPGQTETHDVRAPLNIHNSCKRNPLTCLVHHNGRPLPGANA